LTPARALATHGDRLLEGNVKKSHLRSKAPKPRATYAQRFQALTVGGVLSLSKPSVYEIRRIVGKLTRDTGMQFTIEPASPGRFVITRRG
jgi:hypothetical protein